MQAYGGKNIYKKTTFETEVVSQEKTMSNIRMFDDNIPNETM